MSDSPPPLPPKPEPPSPGAPRKTGMSAGAIVAIVLAVLLVPIIIVAILASLAMPAYNGIRESGMRTKSVSNVRQINLAMRIYATDNNGKFPASNPDGVAFSSSQDAFNLLMPDYIDTEYVFWTQTKEPNHLRPPADDGAIEEGECVYGYAAGQTEKSYTRSPLVFDGFLQGSNAGSSEYLPHLNSGKAVVGFVDGSAAEAALSSKQAGATIMSQDESIKNIMLPRDKGGSLDTSMENINLPIGYSLK